MHRRRPARGAAEPPSATTRQRARRGQPRGAAPLRDRDVLALGRRCGPPVHTDEPAWAGPPRELVLPVLRGPRDDWFTAAALRTLVTARFTVSPDSNRIALRTVGPALERAVPGEPPGEGTVLGAVQVPAAGMPVVFLADCPTTGGYPVAGVVPEALLAAAAQAAPGTAVRFTLVRRTPAHRGRTATSPGGAPARGGTTPVPRATVVR